MNLESLSCKVTDTMQCFLSAMIFKSFVKDFPFLVKELAIRNNQWGKCKNSGVFLSFCINSMTSPKKNQIHLFCL